MKAFRTRTDAILDAAIAWIGEHIVDGTVADAINEHFENPLSICKIKALT